MPLLFGTHRSPLAERGSAGQLRLARRHANSPAGDHVDGCRTCDEVRGLLCPGHPRCRPVTHPHVGVASP